MDLCRAEKLIAAYQQKFNCPDAMSVRKMSHEDFNRELRGWSVDYLQALMVYGEANGYLEYFDQKLHGKTDLTEWGWKCIRMREMIAYKRTVEGKKETLRSLVCKPCRTEEDDQRDRELTKKLTIAATGVGKNAAKQNKLNMQRMEYLNAFEKSIFKGGALREAYEASVRAFQKETECLMTNEQATALAAENRRKMGKRSFFLASFTMPFFLFIRSIDFMCDSFLPGLFRSTYVESKLSVDCTFWSRTAGATVIAGFLSLIIAFEECFVRSGCITTEAITIFFTRFFTIFAIIALYRNVAGIVTDIFVNLTGKLIEKLSWCFEPVTENDYQMVSVSNAYEYVLDFEREIKRREDIIEDLRTVISNNAPYGHVDQFIASCKELSLKTLARNEAEGLMGPNAAKDR